MQSKTLVGYRQLRVNVRESPYTPPPHHVQHHPYGAAVHPIRRARGSQERVGKQWVLVEGTLGVHNQDDVCFFPFLLPILQMAIQNAHSDRKVLVEFGATKIYAH